MVLDSNDEGWFADADELVEVTDASAEDFPLQLGKTLTGDGPAHAL
jgi:hypothetical protein